MALATTTLSTALTGVGPQAETSIVVASAASVAAGRIIQIDGERMRVTKAYVPASTTVPVLRGQEGTFPDIHAASSNVVHGDPQDFADNTPSADIPRPMVTTFISDSYSASGAITQGAAQITFANLIGTSTLAMTLAVPDKTQDGQIMLISANAKSQSTVSAPASGFANAGTNYVKFTFQNAGNPVMMLVANNGFWSPISGAAISGTATAFTVGIGA